jgi:nickel/cobalt transporter (NiCoT) family protein
MDTFLWMILMALLLGLRHGLDLDHLATIDAMARTVRFKPYLSKMTGFLFSLGHGLVVTSISVLIGSGLMKTEIPEWLGSFGNGVSLLFLVLFGLLNLWSVWQPTTEMPSGIKSYLAKKLMGKNINPFLVVAIGALFACSFDTFSQIALFSMSAALMGGWLFSGMLGLFFTLGMMITDGCNGLFVSVLVQRADGMSIAVSRSLGLVISLFSLITAAIVIYGIFYE